MTRFPLWVLGFKFRAFFFKESRFGVRGSCLQASGFFSPSVPVRVSGFSVLNGLQEVIQRVAEPMF